MLNISSNSAGVDEVVDALKCAAEPTRLRLIALLAHGELTVGEICQVLGQSQPRISRHLRLLSEVGFLDRFREEKCVYYRLPVNGRALGWMRQILQFLDPAEPQLRRDRARAMEVCAVRAQAAARALAPGDGAAQPAAEDLGPVLLEELGPAGVGELLDIATGTGGILALLGPQARHAVGVDISSPALRYARSRVHGVGLSHCELHRGDMYELPYPDASFDTVTMHQVLTRAARPAAALREAARTLRPAGRLLIVEQFDVLERAASVDPLRQLRLWLSEAGLGIERLRPVDLPSGHYIVALSRTAAIPTGAPV